MTYDTKTEITYIINQSFVLIVFDHGNLFLLFDHQEWRRGVKNLQGKFYFGKQPLSRADSLANLYVHMINNSNDGKETTNHLMEITLIKINIKNAIKIKFDFKKTKMRNQLHNKINSKNVNKG